MKIDKAVLDMLEKIVGSENFSIGKEDLLVYSYDATKQAAVPDVVLAPRSAKEVSSIMRLASEQRIPVYPRGAGSGLTGGSVPLLGGIVLNMVKMDRILEVDEKNLTAVVEPGVVVKVFQDHVAKLGLFYPPDPASNMMATMGGTVAECAGGLRCLKYGVTRDYVLGLEVVLPNGDIMNFGVRTMKGVTGYDITRLLVGSEGTLAIITRITVKLIPEPPFMRTFLAFFEDIESVMKTVINIIAARILPATLELIDKTCYQAVQQYKGVEASERTGGILLAELDGDEASVEAQKDAVEDICRKNGAFEVRTTTDPVEREEIWDVRRSISPALYTIARKKLNEDICVPRTVMPEIFGRIEKIGQTHGVTIAKFGHAGDGNVHVNVLLEEETPETLERAHKAIEEIMRITVELGGTLSGEHGIGIAKSPYLKFEIPEKEMELMRSLKRLFDPDNILNPGKIFPA